MRSLKELLFENSEISLENVKSKNKGNKNQGAWFKGCNYLIIDGETEEITWYDNEGLEELLSGLLENTTIDNEFKKAALSMNPGEVLFTDVKYLLGGILVVRVS